MEGPRTIYRIWVEDLGTFVNRKTRFTGTKRQMKGRRNSLQALFARTYGDGVVRVYIAPDHPTTPPMYQGVRYHVYDKHGYWQGIYDESTSWELVDKNRDWTRAEVTTDARKS